MCVCRVEKSLATGLSKKEINKNQVEKKKKTDRQARPTWPQGLCVSKPVEYFKFCFEHTSPPSPPYDLIKLLGTTEVILEKKDTILQEFGTDS